MKLSVLFAKYLYQNQQLSLPGIGVFTIDSSVAVPDLSEKIYPDFVQHIKFQQKPVLKADDAFIEFIRTQTGKIRPLAESDLDSFLSDGKILLNIGKPFFLEGIGSLLKTKEGKYQFTPGLPLVDKLDLSNPERITDVTESRTHGTNYSEGGPSMDLRKIIIVLAVIVGLVAVIWGGYLVYNKNSAPVVSQSSEVPQPLSDSSILLQQGDSTVATDTSAASSLLPPPAPNAASQPASVRGSYRFIIETTTSKSRALRRYSQLKSYLLDIRIQTPPDSSIFKLYFEIPAANADTTRIKDSLKRMYNTKLVVIE